MALMHSTKRLSSMLACAPLLGLALAGCSSSDDPSDVVTEEDIIALDALIDADADAAAAAGQVGEPAELLAEARREADKVRADLAAVHDLWKQVAKGAPGSRSTEAGRPVGV